MKTGPHIVSAFDDELLSIQAKIAEMGGLAETMLSDALEAIQQRNIEGCEAVVAMDKRMDRLELDVETLITRVLALRQPMAADLRVLLAGLKLTTTLERMGDLVKNIAKRGIELSRGKPQKLTASIVRMGRETQRQITEVLDAYTSRDTALAVSVWRRDVEIDELYNSIFRELITYMMEDPRLITLGSQYLFIAKNLERIGDHATHIAEMTYYIVEGQPLSDDRPKGTSVGLLERD